MWHALVDDLEDIQDYILHERNQLASELKQMLKCVEVVEEQPHNPGLHPGLQKILKRRNEHLTDSR